MYAAFLGQQVHVKIDRPLGSRHPTLNFIYETNYGFIPGTRAGDGDEIDAYVLGIEQPIDSFDGQCVAVIVRRDDDEHKLVVTRGEIDPQVIKTRTHFVEQYYDTSLILF